MSPVPVSVTGVSTAPLGGLKLAKIVPSEG
jgi:hypothetical protein